MSLNETYDRVRIRKYLSDRFRTKNCLKKGDALLLFNFALKYAIKNVQANQEYFRLNGIHQLLVYADDVNIFSGIMHTIKKNTEDIVSASKEVVLEINTEKIKYMVISRDLNSGC